MIKKAYQDIYHALAINPDLSVAIATLGEINELEGNINGFYLNFRNALEKGLKVDAIRPVKGIYLKYEHEERMVELLRQYDIDFDMIRSL